jgi:hypothetical protein
MAHGEAVEAKGLKFWVMALSGELSIVMVFDAFDAPEEPDVLDPQAASPAASRPAAVMATSLLAPR